MPTILAVSGYAFGDRAIYIVKHKKRDHVCIHVCGRRNLSACPRQGHREDTAVSALVRAYLVDLVQGRVAETRFERLRRLQDETLEAVHARGGGLHAVDNLPRDALHERAALP